MNIVQNKVDDLNLELTLEINKDDYADRRKKRLNAQKRTAEIKGFRKGMVPMSLIERIYGQSALVDAVNDLIAESLNNFIKENNLKVVGEPLPSEDQPKTEWENGNDFTFKFDVAMYWPALASGIRCYEVEELRQRHQRPGEPAHELHGERGEDAREHAEPRR